MASNDAKKMKIAVFYNLPFGGAKRAVYEQVKRLRERGHMVDVYTTDSHSDIFNLKKESNIYYFYNFKLHDKNIPFISRIIKDYDTFIKYKKLHKLIAKDIDKNNYDLVLCHPDLITQAPYILRYLKTKSVYYCQETLRIVYEYNLKADRSLGVFNYVYELITRSIRKKDDIRNARSSNFTIASCLHVRERMIQAYGLWPKVSYLGVDEKKFKPIKIIKKKQIVFFGSVEDPNSGYDLAESAMNMLDVKEKYNLIVIPWKKDNKTRLTDDELVKLYNESILTLSVCRFENFGLIPLESMSCGTPVIATNLSGQRETLRNGIGGYLVDFDPDEICRKILFLLNDKKERSKLSKEGRTYIEKEWTWEKRINELEKLLVEFKINDI